MPTVLPNRAARNSIARAFLPSRWHFHYVRSKLASDPLYGGVAKALEGCDEPLLDLGCGVGLLAHYLAACGQSRDYFGADNDADKITQAQATAGRAGLIHARFVVVDLSDGDWSKTAMNGDEAPYRGSVAILDLLQFLPPAAQAPLLRQAAACICPGARLVIRTGLAGSGWRVRVTRAVDVLSRVLRWMNTGPKDYPQRETLDALLREAGLTPSFSPLWGGTPFNNWLVVAERVDATGGANSGSTQR